MTAARSWPKVLVCSLLALSPAGGSGCLCLGTYWHPIGKPPPEQVGPCMASPQCCRDRVHIFFLNGLDPLNKDNLPGLRDYIQCMGFMHTYYRQLWDYWKVKDEILRIHQEDPEARFVLIGFSFGCNQGLHLTRDFKADGIPIDLLVYLGGDTLSKEDRPDNAGHVLNITAWGCTMLFFGAIWKGVDIPDAENLRIHETGHSGLPSYWQTHMRLARALAVVAANACVPRKSAPVPPPPETAPSPQPMQLPAPTPYNPSTLPPPEKTAPQSN